MKYLLMILGIRITTFFSFKVQEVIKSEQTQNELIEQIQGSINEMAHEMVENGMVHGQSGGINLNMGKTYFITFEVLKSSFRRFTVLVTDVKEITPQEAYELIEKYAE